MAIQFSFALTKEDYINYYTYVFWDAPENRSKRLGYYVRQALPLLAFILAFYYTGVFQRNDVFISIVIVLIIITSGLSLFNVRGNTLRAAERVANKKENSSLFEEKMIEINELGIFTKTNKVEINYLWEAFIRKNETPEYYFLFTSAHYALIIPKRTFPTPAHKGTFEKLLLQHLSFEADFGS